MFTVLRRFTIPITLTLNWFILHRYARGVGRAPCPNSGCL